jgi:GT2 family glycosyltransferase
MQSVRLLVSVVVPTYQRPELLRRCLRDLVAQTAAPDSYEIVVVDDASPEPVEPILAPEFRQAAPAVRWVRVERNSPALARNAGIEAARGDLILFIGDDIFANPRMVEEHLRIHGSGSPRVAGLCRLETDPSLTDSAFARFWDPFGFSHLKGDQVLDCHYFWTNNISVRRELLIRHGGFDTDFEVPHHEDVELGYRLQQAGLRIQYCDRLVGIHHHPFTLESACRMMYGRGAALHVLERKAPGQDFGERLGIFSWRNSPRAVARGLARSMLFNRMTASLWLNWLGQDRESRVRRYFYWKLLIYFANRGYRDALRPTQIHPTALVVS